MAPVVQAAMHLKSAGEKLDVDKLDPLVGATCCEVSFSIAQAYFMLPWVGRDDFTAVCAHNICREMSRATSCSRGLSYSPYSRQMSLDGDTLGDDLPEQQCNYLMVEQ